MTRILIAEDDPLIGSFLEKGFRANGFTTFLTGDGEQAQALGLSDEFDLLLLDMGLNSRDGFHVLQELRSRGKTLPILVLTGRRERDVVMCLEGGADDYMTKPFHFDELLARVKTRLRTTGTQEADVLTAGQIRLDLRTRRATVGENTVDLTAREFALLETLIRHADNVLSREQLLSHVWGYSFDPTTNLVNVYVNSLRKKLGAGHDPDGPRRRLQALRVGLAARTCGTGSRPDARPGSGTMRKTQINELSPWFDGTLIRRFHTGAGSFGCDLSDIRRLTGLWRPGLTRPAERRSGPPPTRRRGHEHVCSPPADPARRRRCLCALRLPPAEPRGRECGLALAGRGSHGRLPEPARSGPPRPRTASTRGRQRPHDLRPGRDPAERAPPPPRAPRPGSARDRNDRVERGGGRALGECVRSRSRDLHGQQHCRSSRHESRRRHLQHRRVLGKHVHAPRRDP